MATYGLAFADQYWQYLAIGFCVGLAGGSFAIGIDVTGTAKSAVSVFIVFYLTCLFVTWWWYRRDGAEVRCD
ncbi:MAG: hypothetical protein QF605_02815 [Rhodospirillales bacterium]|nr:hypothetical protein [Rhodospirillales bacterium]